MIDPHNFLRERFAAALSAAFGGDGVGADPAIHRSAHADYQADVAMALARKLKRSPRDVATALVAHLPSDDVIAAVDVSGPGFINITLQPAFLNRVVNQMAADERLGVPPVLAPENVVVDYSSPNVAKEMHVGHLRSTIIGDAIVRLLSFLGHNVIRQNHIGDWGTPFGMLIEHMLDEQQTGNDDSVRALVLLYKAARAKFDADPAFAERARQRVVLLQQGDAETLRLWRRLVDASVDYMTSQYQRMGITLGPADVRGESAYNADLPAVVSDLQALGLARESENAMCVFPEGFTGREGEPVPLIVRKQDGGYGYATTDLAAVRYRVNTLHAARIIIVVGAPQSQHLAMVFAVARLAGWAPPSLRLEHVAFGSVLGQDKKMYKTRSGDSISLSSLCDEAIERARKVVSEKSPELPATEQQQIAEQVGLGAIKYADLSNDRIKDYVFDWDRMLAFEGNTAPYLMYAHARIRSILRKAGLANGEETNLQVTLAAPEERALGLHLLGFGSVVEKTAESLQPHRVCLYLYDLASLFSGFYEKCPVLKSEGDTRSSRLALCGLTARVLAQGLSLLGIGAPQQM
ncbi:MAG: arginine--tRNA ligase [Deltaproteobacteria bacterium]|nr:arginine--tRNA ligase [Deltaproteobacteria bacterium]